MKEAWIKLNQDGTGTVIVVDDNGVSHDISSQVSSVDLKSAPGRGVQAQLGILWASGEFLATAAHVVPDTAKALIALGWTPPEDTHQPLSGEDKVVNTIKEPDGTVTHWTTRTPAATEPGCQHRDCVLDHPHAGPAVLAREAAR